MNTVRRHPILSKRVWSHEAGLTSVQWVGLSAVALVAIVVIVGVFASGGSQEIQQAASTGTDRRIDCLYNNCQPWENDSSGPRAAAGAGVADGQGLQTAGETVADGPEIQGTQHTRNFWKGLADFWGKALNFGKTLAGKIGDLAGKAWQGLRDWWDGLPGWAKGLIVGTIAAIVIIATVVILVLLGVIAATAMIVVATIVAAIAAIGAGIWYGIKHAADFNILLGFGLSLGAGIVAFFTTVAAWILAPKVAAWLANTAWPWLQQIGARFGQWAVQTAWPAVKALLLAKWKSLVGHYLVYIGLKVVIIDRLLLHRQGTFAEYAIDLGFITVGVLSLPELFASAKFLWSGLLAVGAQVTQQIRQNGFNLSRWDGTAILVAGLVAGLSKLGFEKLPSEFWGAVGDRSVRTIVTTVIAILRGKIGVSSSPSQNQVSPPPGPLPVPVPAPAPTNAPRPRPTTAGTSQSPPAPLNRPAPVPAPIPTPIDARQPRPAPASTPRPTLAPANATNSSPTPAPTSTPRPTLAPANATGSSPAPAPTNTPKPVVTPANTTRSNQAPVPAGTPRPTVTPVNTTSANQTLAPLSTARPTAAPAPTNTPKPAVTPESTTRPNQTSASASTPPPTVTPERTTGANSASAPINTPRPTVTPTNSQ